MLFNSINFLIFFPVVTLAYFLLPSRFRWALLLLASCYFYMAFIPVFILILAFTICVDFIAGIAIEGSEGRRRKQFLMASIVANVGVLFFFKYFNFFNDNLAPLAQALHWNYSLQSLAVILPIGLSFHIFQSLSYTIEVYRGRQKAERHFGIFALYVLFYPQLVAGPIERPQNLLHQFREKHTAEFQRIWSGLELMLYGFFKKLFIADNLAPYVNSVYDNPYDYLAPSFIIATIFFAFQIYCDFSGYSDIAIGAARVMGIRLMNNFRQPYFSRSIGEFWHRWHISLSTWFKDYIYIPMGGSRVSYVAQVKNLLITFILSGLWHGANWTYVVWGALNGCYLILELSGKRIFAQHIHPITNQLALHFIAFVQILFTFMLICLAWVFFRADSFTTAIYIIEHMWSGWAHSGVILTQQDFLGRYILMGRSSNDFYVVIFGISILLLGEYLYIKGYIQKLLMSKKYFLNYILRWFVLATFALLIIVFAKTESQQFIYFQF